MRIAAVAAIEMEQVLLQQEQQLFKATDLTAIR